MAEYFPPTEDLPTFDVLVFREANDIVPYATSSGGTNQVKVQTDNSATPFYPLFSEAGALPSGIARTLYNDPSVTPLSYVPSTSTLTATTFAGALSGTATNANNVNLTVDNSATTYYPVFAASGAGNKPLLYDTTITSLAYIPNPGTLIPEILQARANSQINQMFLGSKNGASIFFGIGSNIPLSNLTTGDFNVGIGGNCLDNLRAGSNNFCMGFNNGRNLRNSSNNCFMGHRAGLVINSNGSTNDYGNVAVGDTSLTNIDASQYNTGVGADTGLDMLNNNAFCSAIGGRANVGNGLSYATAIGAFANCVTSNTVQLGRAADNVNMPNTMSISGLASFFGGGEFNLVCPQTPIAPSAANDLCNKTYVDAIAPANINVTANDTATIHYPVFVTGTGSQQARIDNGLTPLSYVPDTGILTATTFSGALSGNATTATRATNIAGGAGGSIPYQSAINTTILLANGTAGQVLQSNGTTLAPTWTTNISGNAATATRATNIAGGVASQIPYQTALNTTGFISNGSANQILTSNGTGVPTWILILLAMREAPHS